MGAVLMNFEELNLAAAIVKAVREQGYETPTAIQAQAIPLILEGHDLLGGAQTGTGKTAAFTLPMLHRLSMSRSAQNKFGGTGIRALVLTPTRELAAQVERTWQATDLIATKKPFKRFFLKGFLVFVAYPGSYGALTMVRASASIAASLCPAGRKVCASPYKSKLRFIDWMYTGS